MIRYKRSLFLSFLFHTAVVAFALYGLDTVLSTPKEEKKISLNLCHCVESCPCEAMNELVVKKSVQKEKERKKENAPKKIVKKEKLKKEEPKREIKKPLVQEAQVSKPTEQTQTSTPSLEPKEVSFVNEKAPLAPQTDSLEKAEKISPQAEYIQDNLSIIAQMIKENLYYPQRARLRHLEGRVVVKFTLLKDSTIKDVLLIDGSYEILNSSAIKSVNNLNGKLPPPKEDITLEVPINFRLY